MTGPLWSILVVNGYFQDHSHGVSLSGAKETRTPDPLLANYPRCRDQPTSGQVRAAQAVHWRPQRCTLTSGGCGTRLLYVSPHPEMTPQRRALRIGRR
jgi:hypothetical protein